MSLRHLVLGLVGTLAVGCMHRRDEPYAVFYFDPLPEGGLVVTNAAREERVIEDCARTFFGLLMPSFFSDETDAPATCPQGVMYDFSTEQSAWSIYILGRGCMKMHFSCPVSP